MFNLKSSEDMHNALDTRVDINAMALDSIRAFLYKNLYDSTWDFASFLNDDIKEKRIKDLTNEEALMLIQKWVFEYGNRDSKQLSEYSDSDIVNEMNRRIQNGTINSLTRFHVTNKGSI